MPGPFSQIAVTLPPVTLTLALSQKQGLIEPALTIGVGGGFVVTRRTSRRVTSDGCIDADLGTEDEERA